MFHKVTFMGVSGLQKFMRFKLRKNILKLDVKSMIFSLNITYIFLNQNRLIMVT